MNTDITVFGSALRRVVMCLALLVVMLPAAPPAAGQTMVNVATDATDPFNLRDTEPSIAVNPANPQEIIIVTFSEPWESQQGAPIWRSTDGGATWTKIRVISQPPTGGAGPGDQAVMFNPTGRLFVAELESGPGIGTKPLNYIYRQNGGVDSPFLRGLTYGDDQPLIATQRATAGPCANHLYSPWLGFPHPSDSTKREQSKVSHSADDGANMTEVGAGDNSQHPNRTTRIAVAPSGRVYVVYKARHVGQPAAARFERAQFRVNRSDDCGATWSVLGAGGVSVHGPDTVQTWFTNEFGNAAKGEVNRARSSDAWIAVDPSDEDVYVVYTNLDGSGRGQLFVARSTDRGLSWTSTQVTDGLNHSAFPEIAVADNGAVGVLFIDYDDSGPATIFRHRFARSTDDGATWTVKTLQSMNPSLIPVTKTFIWGDYEGLTAAGNTFYGVFTGQSLPGKRTTSQLDPIFFTEPATP